MAQALADSTHTILQTLADTILEVFQCDSAGVSLLTTNDGGKRFYWPAIAGGWKPHIGGGTPRDFGPCGDVLDSNCPLMFRHFEQFYTYLPPVEECLLVPFYVEGKAVGTIWAISEGHRRQFDAEDMRQLVSLGRFASAAYQAVTSLRTKAQLAAIVESSDDAIMSADLNGIILSWNAGAERLFGYTAAEAVGQSVTMVFPLDRLDEDFSTLERIRSGEYTQYETVRHHKDGTPVDISLSISPIIDASGKIVGASQIARDIAERKRVAEALRLNHVSLEHLVEQRTIALRKLSASLLRSQDEERRKISRELHDSIGQHLAAAKMNLAALERPDATEKERRSFLNAMDVLDTCVAETRTISSLLHPPLLDELGLRSAVNIYVEDFSQRSGIRVNLDTPAELKRFPVAFELVLFRVLQESLTNIHRHANSQSVDVQLKLVPDTIRLQVRDYGRGMSPELLRKFRSDGTGVGIGLRSIRERISELEGQFEIESDKNGTLIRVAIPLSHALTKQDATGNSSGA